MREEEERESVCVFSGLSVALENLSFKSFVRTTV